MLSSNAMFNKITLNLFVKSILLLLLFINLAIFADPPPGYYDSAKGLTGKPLRLALHNIIKDHTRLSYSPDTRNVLALADENPEDSDYILDIYKNASYLKTDTTSWNREHAWPKSYGFPDDLVCNYPYTDCHHLFACDATYNSTRGNNPFDECVGDCTAYPVEPVEKGYANYRSSESGPQGSWEVWIGRRGDVARALFYLDVRYEGGTHGITACAEPNLILTNNREEIVTSDDNITTAFMGILDTLIIWHKMDPVDDKERHRNDAVYQYQGNRNPFIDHPEWVIEIWDDVPTPTPTPTPVIGISPGDIVINEIDYDDPGADDQSFVELKNISGSNIDLSLLRVIGLSSGTAIQYFDYQMQSHVLPPGAYHVLGTTSNSGAVSGSIDETMTGVSLLQNGANDGVYLCLADYPTTIIDSVSYEGDLAHPEDSPDSGGAGMDAPVNDNYSLSRIPDGTDSDNNTIDFIYKGATPGDSNSTPTPTPTPSPTPSVINPGDIVINEIDYDDPGTDDQSFVELKNVSGSSIDLSLLRVIGFSSGTATQYFDYQMQSHELPSGAYHVLGTTSNSGAVSGSIEETMTGVSIIQNGSNDGIYLCLADSPSTIIDSVSYEGDLAHPEDSPDSGDAGQDSPTNDNYSLSRIPDGTDTDNNTADFIYKEATPGDSNSTSTPLISGFFLR